MDSSKSIDTVVFDFPSVVSLFLHFNKIRKAGKIIIYQANEKFTPLGFSILKFMLRLLNFRDVQIHHIEGFFYMRWNPDVVELIEKNEYKRNRKIILKMCQLLDSSRQNAGKYFKKLLILPVAKKLYIKRQISSSSKKRTYLIITDDNTYGIYDDLDLVFEDKWIFRSIMFPLVVFVGIFVVLCSFVTRFKITWRRRVGSVKDFLVQVNIFGYENDIRKEYRVENYVFDKKRVGLLITRGWRPSSSEQMVKYKEYLRKRGIDYLDVMDFTIEPFELISAFNFSLKSIRNLQNIIGSWCEFVCYFGLLHQILCEGQYIRNYNCKAIMGFDDYSTQHIVRTLLCRQQNILSMGVQHSVGNGLHGVPELAYVCFDKYFIFGEFQKELFNGYWDDLDLVELSYNRIDNFLKSRRCAGVDVIYAKNVISRSSKKNIVITLPSISSFEKFLSMFPNAKGMRDFLHDVDESILSFANVYVRPKYSSGIEKLRRYINNSAVCFLVENSFTTTELLSQADLVIASGGSGVICECCLLRTKVITYDYLGCLRKYWTKFGSDMCAQNKHELHKTVSAFVRDELVDVDWDLLWSNIVYPNDGDSNQIIKRVIDQHCLS